VALALLAMLLGNLWVTALATVALGIPTWADAGRWRRAALLVAAGALLVGVALVPVLSPLRMLHQLRLLGLLAGAWAVLLVVVRPPWRAPLCIAAGWALLRHGVVDFPDAARLVRPWIGWGAPAVVAIAAWRCVPTTAVAAGGAALATLAAWTATGPGLAWGVAALTAATFAAVACHLDLAGPGRGLAVGVALAGPTTWGVLQVGSNTLPALSLTSVLLMAVTLVFAMSVAARSVAGTQGALGWGLSLAVCLAALVPHTPGVETAAEALATRASRHEIPPDDTLGWRWLTRHASRSAVGSADAGP